MRHVILEVLEKAKKFFTVDIQKDSIKNNNFRKVLFTADNIQLVVMSLHTGESIGIEKHPDVDQFFRIEKGEACFFVNEKKVAVLHDGGSFIVPRGNYHNIVNTGKGDLKLYTIYGPPNHPDGLVHKTKAEAVKEGD